MRKESMQMTIEYKIRFLEDCRTHPEKYLPLISHA